MELERKNLLVVKKSVPEQGTTTSDSPFGGAFSLLLQPIIKRPAKASITNEEYVNFFISS
jgi:hypothetical protein